MFVIIGPAFTTEPGAEPLTRPEAPPAFEDLLNAWIFAHMTARLMPYDRDHTPRGQEAPEIGTTGEVDWSPVNPWEEPAACGVHTIGDHALIALGIIGFPDEDPDQTRTGKGDPLAEVHGLSDEDTIANIDAAIGATTERNQP